MTDSLRERCKAFYQMQTQNAIMRTGSPVDDLVAFVVAEIGRSADTRLDKTLPLCCYFANEADREQFIAAVQSVFPNMTARKMP